MKNVRISSIEQKVSGGPGPAGLTTMTTILYCLHFTFTKSGSQLNGLTMGGLLKMGSGISKVGLGKLKMGSVVSKVGINKLKMGI